MSQEIWNFVGRKPRHQAANASRVTVRLKRGNAQAAADLRAELIDFARSGAQLRVADDANAACPASGEPIVLELLTGKPELDIRLPGKIRWQQAEGPGRWLVGCEFDTEVSLETLGELFLNEILCDGRSAEDGAQLAAVEPHARQG